CQQHDDYPLTF
nr:immunoglobulin light chain junction region [Macaca mulatta]MOV34049.1 immunoglobulin light chain junction region [Macaca mulatta]MOV34065.1 immunoglobulin light chain junction region [Macaca mulatta]MOV34084.1 immunoglobulin light chain junction region [Macaca mulatta]MOV34104.1 immunoglobulin light chain junction region [Macaca mulatta]